MTTKQLDEITTDKLLNYYNVLWGQAEGVNIEYDKEIRARIAADLVSKPEITDTCNHSSAVERQFSKLGAEGSTPSGCSTILTDERIRAASYRLKSFIEGMRIAWGLPDQCGMHQLSDIEILNEALQERQKLLDCIRDLSDWVEQTEAPAQELYPQHADVIKLARGTK